MPTIPEHLQVRSVNDLAAAVGVLVVIEKPGIRVLCKFPGICLVPAVSKVLQISSIHVAIAINISEDSAEDGKIGTGSNTIRVKLYSKSRSEIHSENGSGTKRLDYSDIRLYRHQRRRQEIKINK